MCVQLSRSTFVVTSIIGRVGRHDFVGRLRQVHVLTSGALLDHTALLLHVTRAACCCAIKHIHATRATRCCAVKHIHVTLYVFLFTDWRVVDWSSGEHRRQADVPLPSVRQTVHR